MKSKESLTQKIETMTRMRNKKRSDKALLLKRSKLIDDAIECDCLTVKKICEFTELKPYVVRGVLDNNLELRKKYAIRRRGLMDIAADSMQDIIEDPTHPQHFQACKYALQNFKSEFDDILDNQDSTQLAINPSGGDTSMPVTIVFGKKDSK